MAKVKKEDIKKVVLAYSGGLDTSVIIPWLKDNYNNCEVIAVCADLGQGDELDPVHDKAIKSGASKCYILDLKEDFIAHYVWPCVRAGAVYEKKYLLGTSFARPLIAKHLVDIAHKEGADAVAHGATGKGNDQVRFELSVKSLDPDLAIIAPWREWELRSRDQEIDYAEAHNIPIPVSHSDDYSMDRNMWHLSHEGSDLEDPWNAPKAKMFRVTCTPETAPDKPEMLKLRFVRGVPVAVNGRKMSPAAIVEKLNEIGIRKRGERVRTHDEFSLQSLFAIALQKKCLTICLGQTIVSIGNAIGKVIILGQLTLKLFQVLVKQKTAKIIVGSVLIPDAISKHQFIITIS